MKVKVKVEGSYGVSELINPAEAVESRHTIMSKNATQTSHRDLKTITDRTINRVSKIRRIKQGIKKSQTFRVKHEIMK